MNYSNNNKRRLSPDPPSSTIASKWLRVEETMIENKNNISGKAASSSSSSGEVRATMSCGEAAAAQSSSQTIVGNILSPRNSPPKQMGLQQACIVHSSSSESTAQPQETTVTPAASVEPSAAAAALRNSNKKSTVQSPNDFFTGELKSRGYPANTHCSLKGGYHNTPTKHQTSSYGISLTRAIRSSDKQQVHNLLSTGLNPNACNKFGESIIHAVCRRGDHDLLRILLDAGSSVQVSDDFGRTPLHDACWTPSPNFETISLLLEKDPWLLSITDCRGCTPLGYVRKAHWAVWNGFLSAIIDRYWPPCTDAAGDCITSNEEKVVGGQSQGNDQQDHGNKAPKVPPLSLVQPDSKPIVDPPDARVKSLDILELLANGKIDLQDLDKKDPDAIMKVRLNEVEVSRRITFDPLRSNGANATVMKGSDPIAQSYVRVSTPS